MKLERMHNPIVFLVVLLVFIAIVPTSSLPTIGYADLSLTYANGTNCSTIEDVYSTNVVQGSKNLETCIFFGDPIDGVWIWFNCSDTTGDWWLYEYDTKRNCVADWNRTSPDYGPANSSYSQCASDGDTIFPYYFKVVCPLPVVSLTFRNGTNCSTIDEVSNTNVHEALPSETCIWYGDDPLYSLWIWFNCSDITGEWWVYEYDTIYNCLADTHRNSPTWGPANSTYNQCAWDKDPLAPYYYRVLCPIHVAVVYAEVKVSHHDCEPNTERFENYTIPIESCTYVDEIDPNESGWVWLHCDENSGDWKLYEYDSKTECVGDHDHTTAGRFANSTYATCASDGHPYFPYYFHVTCPLPVEYADVKLTWANGTNCSTIDDLSNTGVVHASKGIETCLFLGDDLVYGTWIWFNCSDTGNWWLYEYDTKWNCLADSDRTSPDYGPAHAGYNQCASDNVPVTPYYFKVHCPLNNGTGGTSTGTIIGGSTGGSVDE